MKKLLSVLLAAVMIVFSIPITAFADYEDEFELDATSCEFVLTPDKTEIEPGDTVNYTLSLKPNGKIYGLQAHLVLPKGFTLEKGSGKLLNELSAESLGWGDLAVTETEGGKLIFTGYTSNKPYTKAELKLATFSCRIEEGTVSGALSLEKYFVLNESKDKVLSTVTSPNISVIYDAEDDATACTFRLTADRTTVHPGDTVDFVLSLIPNGKIYGFQAKLSLPENFSLVNLENDPKNPEKFGELIAGVKELLGWDDISVTKASDGGLNFAGYTAKNPYSTTSELKVARFSCKVGENAESGTVSLYDYFALVNISDRLKTNTGDFPLITVEPVRYTVTIPENVTVTRSGIKLTDGAAVNTGDILTITANAPDGYKLSSLTVNGEEFTSGENFSVGTENVVIAVKFAKEGEFSVAFPAANVTVTRNGVALKSGDMVNFGDILTITVNVPSGYKLNSLKVNGVSISNGGKYTVGSENITIEVDIVKSSTGSSGSGGSSGGSSGSSGSSGGSGSGGSSYYRTIIIPENVSVRTKNGTPIYNGDSVYIGDELIIEAAAPAGKKLVSLTVNGEEFKSGDIYTVVSSTVIVKVEFEDITEADTPAPVHTVTVPANVIVTRDNLIVNNGDEIKEGDVLFITALTPGGYMLSSLSVNGKAVASGSKYTVGNENVVITASFEKLPDDFYAPFVTSDPDRSGWDAINELLSVPTDTTVMIDMNGSTVLPQRTLYLIKTGGNKVLLKMNDKVSWSIDGKDIDNVSRDVDLKVTLNVNTIPEDALKKLAGNRDHLTFTIAHNGDLGFNALLVINVGERYNAEKADLYWYNNNEFKSDGSCEILYGMAVLEISHASDWVIAFGDSNGSSDNSQSSGTSDPNTSKPDATLPNGSQTNDPNNNNSTTEPDDKSKDKDNDMSPNTGSRVSLKAFLALIASAAACLFSSKRRTASNNADAD